MHKLVTADNVFIDARLNYETKCIVEGYNYVTISRHHKAAVSNIKMINLESSRASNKAQTHKAYGLIRQHRTNFCRCTVHSDTCRVHSPTSALILI